MKHVLLVLILVAPWLASADEYCSEKRWLKAPCLRQQAQIADEEATATYWALQNKIKALPAAVGPKEYSTQLSKLLKRNELDFITYTESYCNMKVVLATVETELNKILMCQIQTAKLRTQELNSIIDDIDGRGANQ